ncbi:hemolysin family protein [Planomicrobium soli]|uniref:hemolysin family protein n=1 Tax=Planomicrobium soli TaxID=1176648 RepID=UPI0011B29E0E|nr:hemolysin family protein [Planomicrobium soli]
MILFAVLVACAAFFSASEYALSKFRSIPLNQFADEKDKITVSAKKRPDTDNYLLFCLIGFALAVFGWSYGTIVKASQPLFMATNLSNNAQALLTFSITVTTGVLILVAFGKLAWKNVKIPNLQPIVLWNIKPYNQTYRLSAFFISLIKSSAIFIPRLSRTRRFKHSINGYATEELKRKLAESYQSGSLVPFKYAYASRILDLNRLLAKEIMVPRTKMVTFKKNLTVKEVLFSAGTKKLTRYPIIDKDKDHVIGFINMKHLLTAYAKDPSIGDLPAAQYIYPIIQVIGSIKTSDLLLKMQIERTHMAILRDEYGGTCGLITMEDIIKEIVGDIRDEFNSDEVSTNLSLYKRSYVLDSKMPIDEVN